MGQSVAMRAWLVGVASVVLMSCTAGGGGQAQSPSTSGAAGAPTVVPEVSTSASGGGTTAVTSTTVVAPLLVTDVSSVVSDAGVLDGVELYRASLGDGERQLGVESCTECDPARPLSPVVLPDGSVVINDFVNRRWVVVSPGGEEVEITPFLSGSLPVSSPALGPDGAVYVLESTADSADGSSDVLRVYVGGNMAAPAREFAAQGFLSLSAITFEGSRAFVRVGDSMIEIATLPLDVGERADVQFFPGGRVWVTWSGQTRQWNFPAADGAGGVSPDGRLPDGTVLVFVHSPGENGAGHYVMLRPSGHAVQFAVPAVAAMNGAVQLVDNGIVQLEFDGDELVVTRYELPSPEAS